MTQQFSRIQADRESADYDRAAVFEADTAPSLLDEVEEFCQACQALLETSPA